MKHLSKRDIHMQVYLEGQTDVKVQKVISFRILVRPDDIII